MEDELSLQQAVRALRHSFGDTQEEFARRLGVSVRSVLNYELDKPPRGIRLIQLMQLANTQNLPQIASVFVHHSLANLRMPVPTSECASLVFAVKALDLEIAKVEARMGKHLAEEVFLDIRIRLEKVHAALEKLLRSYFHDSEELEAVRQSEIVSNDSNDESTRQDLKRSAKDRRQRKEKPGS